jgi:hypothetical protein
MSLNKAIEHGKEHRKPYRGGKAIDKTCRNHGGCSWCEGNRKHKFLKKMQEKISDIREEER